MLDATVEKPANKTAEVSAINFIFVLLRNVISIFAELANTDRIRISF